MPYKSIIDIYGTNFTIKMTKLIFIRHGESEANKTGIFAGFSDFDLSEKGREQAERTAEYVFKNFKVDKIYSSDLKRAYNTALPISEKFGLEIIKDERLREINIGDWEGKIIASLVGDPDFEIWRNDIGKSVAPNGESIRQLSERFFAATDEIAKSNIDKTVVIVTHATALRTLVCRFSKKDIDDMKDVGWVTNASVTTIDYDGEYKICELSHDEHLEGIITHVSKYVSS